MAKKKNKTFSEIAQRWYVNASENEWISKAKEYTLRPWASTEKC